MVQHIGRWVLPLLALFLVGPSVGALVGGLRARDGGPDVSLFVSSSPMYGLFAGLLSLAGAAILGVVGARVVDMRTGMMSAGLVLAWAAWRTGMMSWVLALDPGVKTLALLAFEGAVVVGLALGIAVLLQSGRFGAVDQDESKKTDRDSFLKDFLSRAGLAGVAVGVFAALAVAHVVVFSPMRGQALLGAIVGGIAAGALGRLTSLALTDKPISVVPIYTSVLIAAIVGPLVGVVAPGGDRLSGAILAGTVPGPVLVQPLDWAAGLLIGVPIGLGWAAASVGKSQHTPSVRVR